MIKMMVCPPSPLGYTQYERCYHANDWWFRASPTSPWQLCKDVSAEVGEEIADHAEQTLEYMCELLEANEIEPSEFRRQLQSEGFGDETITSAIRRTLPYGLGA